MDNLEVGSFHTAPIRAPASPLDPYGSGMGVVQEAHPAVNYSRVVVFEHSGVLSCLALASAPCRWRVRWGEPPRSVFAAADSAAAKGLYIYLAIYLSAYVPICPSISLFLC